MQGLKEKGGLNNKEVDEGRRRNGRTGGRRGSRKRVRRAEDEKPKLHAGDGWPQPLPLFESLGVG